MLELETSNVMPNPAQLKKVFLFTASTSTVAPRIGQAAKYLNAGRIARFPSLGDEISPNASNG
jgi:hypothetical protein